LCYTSIRALPIWPIHSHSPIYLLAAYLLYQCHIQIQKISANYRAFGRDSRTRAASFFRAQLSRTVLGDILDSCWQIPKSGCMLVSTDPKPVLDPIRRECNGTECCYLDSWSFTGEHPQCLGWEVPKSSQTSGDHQKIPRHRLGPSRALFENFFGGQKNTGIQERSVNVFTTSSLFVSEEKMPFAPQVVSEEKLGLNPMFLVIPPD